MTQIIVLLSAILIVLVIASIDIFVMKRTLENIEFSLHELVDYETFQKKSERDLEFEKEAERRK